MDYLMVGTVLVHYYYGSCICWLRCPTKIPQGGVRSIIRSGMEILYPSNISLDMPSAIISGSFNPLRGKKIKIRNS